MHATFLCKSMGTAESGPKSGFQDLTQFNLGINSCPTQFFFFSFFFEAQQLTFKTALKKKKRLEFRSAVLASNALLKLLPLLWYLLASALCVSKVLPWALHRGQSCVSPGQKSDSSHIQYPGVVVPVIKFSHQDWGFFTHCSKTQPRAKCKPCSLLTSMDPGGKALTVRLWGEMEDKKM